MYRVFMHIEMIHVSFVMCNVVEMRLVRQGCI